MQTLWSLFFSIFIFHDLNSIRFHKRLSITRLFLGNLIGFLMFWSPIRRVIRWVMSLFSLLRIILAHFEVSVMLMHCWFGLGPGSDKVPSSIYSQLVVYSFFLLVLSWLLLNSGPISLPQPFIFDHFSLGLDLLVILKAEQLLRFKSVRLFDKRFFHELLLIGLNVLMLILQPVYFFFFLFPFHLLLKLFIKPNKLFKIVTLYMEHILLWISFLKIRQICSFHF